MAVIPGCLLGSTAKKMTPSQNLGLGEVVVSLDPQSRHQLGFPDIYTKHVMKSLAMLSGSLYGAGKSLSYLTDRSEAELIGWRQQAER